MKAVTPSPRVTVGASLEIRGFHKLWWVKK